MLPTTTITKTAPQDMVERSRGDEQGASLHFQRYPNTEIEHIYDEFLRQLLGRNQGAHRGRLTGCGQISTGGGGANVAFTARSLISGGWKQARVEIDPTGANNGLIWEAIAPGVEANTIQVEYVDNAGATAVDWNATTRVITVGYNVGGGGDTVANVKTALAASASGAQYVVQVRDSHGSTGGGTLTAAYTAVYLTGGTGSVSQRAVLTMAQAGNKDLEFEAVDYGEDAKTVYMVLVNDATADPPTVAVSEAAASVTITVSAKIGTSTALHIRQALRDSADAMKWIHVRLADGSSGAGLPAAFTAAALTAPFGTDGFTARVGSLVANVQTLTDDGGTFDCATGVGTAGDTVELVLVCCGIEHRITAAVVA